MQDNNQGNSPKSTSTPNERIAAGIANLINSISQSFQLSEREEQVQKQWLENMKNSKLLQAKQEFINEANYQMPILLTSKTRLIVLESILVARARDGKPIDDLVTAIEVVRKNVIDFDLQSNQTPQPQKNTQIGKNKDEIIKYEHRYDLPILSEIGILIYDLRNILLLAPLLAVIYVLFFSITNPRICYK
ncbi:hypothetical protein I8752_22880 [Nostocaceae cyanobacterium CENA369]|uniref:Uncharacterized protein n=1 Tax=Dendronalium phyllosphericum CENA369 TaxID=1725256 RepID=A0A8J7I7S6_9NOST|nr:hypothetical protein [Dendronalium phyllosphericum]MBH8575793.1 hypothetical protein [Dendronalium phyllosphericum CENA369]